MLVPDPSRESWRTISQTQTWDDGGNYRLRCTLQHADLETPFGSRSSGHLIDMVGATDTAEGFAQEREWARDCWTALAPHHAGVFVNWLMDEGEERVRQAYGNMKRLTGSSCLLEKSNTSRSLRHLRQVRQVGECDVQA
jgi:hypothetical protein